MDLEDVLDAMRPWAEIVLIAFLLGLDFALGVKAGLAIWEMI